MDTLVSFFCARCFKYSETSTCDAVKNLIIVTTDLFEDFILEARGYPGSVTFLGREILQIYLKKNKKEEKILCREYAEHLMY